MSIISLIGTGGFIVTAFSWIMGLFGLIRSWF